jgi:uncharacterized membrane protein
MDENQAQQQPQNQPSQDQVQQPGDPQQPLPQLDGTEKLLSALGYIGFLCVLPLVLRRDSKFCNYHGKQGLILAIFDMAIRLFSMFTGFYTVLLILFYLLLIYCIVRAFRGDYFTLPVVSELAGDLKI